jgi:UDP-GlcNAc:undecaprenyl-phosphate GlcNAc-1-phosphate transferase
VPAKISIFIFGAVITWLLGFVVIKLAFRFQFLDQPGGRKAHHSAIPYGGGLMIFLGCMLQCAVYLLIYLLNQESFQTWFPGVHFDATIKESKGWAIFLGALAMLVLGAVDDRVGLSAQKKLGLQILITALTLWFGNLSMSFFVPNPWLGFLGTLFWVILITNAFNLIDNMDGLCGGVCLITLGLHIILLSHAGHLMVEMASIVCLSSVFAFLIFNKPPAKLYLGDSGSYFLGFLMAMLSVMATYYREGQSLAGILTPVLILAVPLFDVATVLWIRTKLGQPWFQADRNHFSHRLLALGLSEWQSLAVILMLSLVCGMGGLLLGYLSNTLAWLVFSQCVMVLFVIHFLERAGQSRDTMTGMNDVE